MPKVTPRNDNNLFIFNGQYEGASSGNGNSSKPVAVVSQGGGFQPTGLRCWLLSGALLVFAMNTSYG
jgi:hypothetical protein